jgi:hypothetical protein
MEVPINHSVTSPSISTMHLQDSALTPNHQINLLQCADDYGSLQMVLWHAST